MKGPVPAKQQREGGIMRALKGESAVKQDVKPVVTPVAVPEDALAPGDKSLGAVKQMQPYLGRESLPDAKKDANGLVVGPGEPRYFVANHPGGGDLIAVYRKRCGVGRKLIKVLKDKKKGKLGDKDRAFRRKLAEMGIPGAA